MVPHTEVVFPERRRRVCDFLELHRWVILTAPYTIPRYVYFLYV